MNGERILIISQHLAKLWARVRCPFWLTGQKLWMTSLDS